jgi:hypothetical protein
VLAGRRAHRPWAQSPWRTAASLLHITLSLLHITLHVRHDYYIVSHSGEARAKQRGAARVGLGGDADNLVLEGALEVKTR